MEGYYTSYRCKGCNKEIILITEELKRTLASGKYVSCSHWGCKRLRKDRTTDIFKECMNHSAYKRIHGAIRQVR